MSPCRQLSIAAVLGLAAGCASLEAPFGSHLASDTAERRACAEWFQKLDERVDAAGVRDAQETRIAGFPYLRVSRLLAALRPAAVNEETVRALAERMSALDLESRGFEIMNLPAGQAGDMGESRARTQYCGQLLREIDLANPDARRALLERAQVPDDYILPHRIFGLYAFTSIAFAAGIRRYEEQVRAAYRQEAFAPASGAVVIRYAPPPGPPLSRGRVATILARAAMNPLGIPEAGEAELAELFTAYAPSFEIAVAGDYDRFGALRWPRDGQTPMVDGSDLAVYTQTAWTRYRDRVLLQLVYTIWFPERPAREAGDILAGKLDGITWRVTLAPNGEPLIYDTIHPCGCYHLFFPTPRAQALPAPTGPEEWMFSPQTLPAIAEGERPVLRIASGTHYIERVASVRGSDSLARYELRPYGELRSMPRLGRGRASAFGPDGLVRGTQRPERYLFWPTGIDSAGAMRQWGRQATAFVGRRHFDDPDLLEKRFRLELR